MLLSPQQIAQQLEKLKSEKRVIFIHPNYKAQNLILGQLLEDALYVLLGGAVLTQEDLREQLSNAERLLDQPAVNYKLVLLDECDRAQATALISFVPEVLKRFPKARLVLFSRVLFDGILDDPEIRQQAVFIPADSDLMLWDYTQVDDQSLLEVRAFGDGRVHLDGKSIESWDGALPRSLFFYLVDRAMVTRAEIFETFWPNLTTREATNVFHVTKRKISEVLGTELTVYGSGFYHISPKIHLSYDVSLFNQLVQDSDSANADTTALQQALALCRGDYLASISMEWVEKRRSSLQQSACDALVSLARSRERENDFIGALNAYLRASHMRPEREDTALAVMRLYQQLDLPQDALLVYERLDNALRAQLDVAPSQQIQQLATEIRQSLDSTA